MFKHPRIRARKTTAPTGYGTAGRFVDLIDNGFPCSTAEPIVYSAQGDNAYVCIRPAGHAEHREPDQLLHQEMSRQQAGGCGLFAGHKGTTY